MKSLVAQNRYEDARSIIEKSSVEEQERKRLSALVYIGLGEKSMTAGQYASAVNHFSDALREDPGNKHAARDSCLAAYRFFANRPFHTDDPSRPDQAALNSAVDACKRTAYGSQLLPFISSNLNAKAPSR